MGQNTIDFVSKMGQKPIVYVPKNGAKPPNTVVKMGQKERIYNQLIYKLDDLPCTNSNRTS